MNSDMDAPQSRILCDVQGCPATFGRPQDLGRHKREVHADSKKCPWCDYASRRDQRVLDHIDENHRPRKHKLRLSVDSTSQVSPKQDEDFRPKDSVASQTMDSSSIQVQEQSAFNESVSGLGLLKSQNKRAAYQQTSSSLEDVPTLTPQFSASLLFQARPQAAHGRDIVDGSRTNRGLPMRPRTMAGSENVSGTQVVKTSRDVSVKHEQSSFDTSTISNHPLGMSQDMSIVRHDQFNQGVQQNLLQAYSSSQPRVHFEPTPLSSSPYASQAPFYDFALNIPQGTTQSFSASQNSPSFTTPMSPASQSNPSYMSPSTYTSPHISTPVYPHSFAQTQTAPSTATQFGQDENLVFLHDEEYEVMKRSSGWP